MRADQAGELAAAVLGRRERLGLRQEELAELAGCSPRFVHAIEAGKKSLQLDKLVAVLDALGLHLAISEGGSPQVTTSAPLKSDLRLDRSGRDE
ncbi:helix-turn-helix domain-containing protein [Nocardioides sp. AE5]|uniref:helix-turn-helix domain-containing protein n=1 Tax=Nocardioides sp. AE5 TaxID=2962573 RepID=UPI0037CB3A6D